MNLKKLKRLLCIALSAAMALSTNMTGFAAETGQVKLVMEENEAPGKEAPKDSLDLNTGSSGSRSNARVAISTAAADACTSHTVIAVPRKAPTCFTEGMAAHYTCGACNKLYKTKANAEAQTGEVTEDSLKIVKLNHNAVSVAEAEADCTTEGRHAYFTCNICKRIYLTMEDVYDDVEDKSAEESTCLSTEEIESEITIKALGHSYETKEEDGTKKSTVEVQGWDRFDPAKYEEGTACGLTASRSCTRCTNYTQETEDVSVKLVPPEDGPYNCTQEGGIDVSYTITATFTNEEENPSSTGEDTDEETVKKEKHVTGHSYKYEFQWPEDKNSVFKADEEGKLALDEDNKVVLNRVCAVCAQEDAGTDSVDAMLTADGVAVGYTLKCYPEEKSFTATATFGEGDNAHTETSEGVKLTLPVGEHALQAVNYKAATCTEEGHEAHYYCTNEGCGQKFWDEEGTGVEPGESVDIPALGHNILPPEYAFEGSSKLVKATFRCMRSATCGAEVTKFVREEDIQWDQPEISEEDQKAPCNEEIDVSYPVCVKFDRNVVEFNEEENKWFEDTDDENYNADFTYNGKVPRKEKVQHDFTVTYNWAGEAETENDINYYNPEDGVIATLTCNKCSGVAKIGTAGVSADKLTVTDATELELVEGAELTRGQLDTTHDDYKAANCSAGGLDVYPVSLSGVTADAAATQIDEDGIITNNTKKSGHKYIVSNVIEGTFDSTTDKPVIASMQISCALGDACPDKDSITVNYTPSSSSGITVEFEEVTGTDVAGELQQATCTTNGYRVWAATITMADGGKAYAEYATDGTGTPVVISVEAEATGHDFSAALGEEDWDWTEFGTADEDGNFVPSNQEGAKVYATYKCQHTNCDGVRDAGTEPAGDSVIYGTGTDGKRFKKVGVEPESDNDPDITCGNGKEITYTATIESDTSTRKQTTTGHEWSDIEWSKWTDANTTKEITLANGKTFLEEVYTIAASRQCRNCTEKQEFSTEADSDGSVITIATDRPATEANTCTSPGSTIYWATLTLYEDGEEDVIENPLPGVHVYPATGHKYEIGWAWTAEVKNSNGETVPKTEDELEEGDEILRYTGATASKKCANCQKEIGIDTGYGMDGVNFTAPDGKIQCTATDVFTYIAQARFVDDADDVYTDTRRVIHQKKERHNYSWELSGWDEEAQTVTVTATCDDNEEHTFTAEDVPLTVTEKETVGATCVSGPKTSVTGTFTVTDPADQKTYEGSGTYESGDTEGADEDAHAYPPVEIDWEKAALTETGRDDTNVYYETEVTVACTLDASHTDTVTVVAAAPVGQIEAIDCSQNYKIDYTLSFKDAAAAEAKGITLAKPSDTVSHAAGSHDLERRAGQAGSCTEAGWKTHYHCKVCGNNYTSTAGTTKVDVEMTAPLGHLYGDPVFEWVKEGESARAIFTCTRSGCTTSIAGHTKVVDAKVDTDDASIYKEGEAGCVDSPNVLTYYYMVSYTDADGNVYEGDLEQVQPKVDHDFSGEGGKCIYCNKTGLVKVSFIYKSNGTDVTISTAWYGENEAYEVPSAPSRPGYTFGGWSIDGTNPESDIRNAIAEAAGAGSEIIVTALYREIQAVGTVTVKYLADGTGKELGYAKPGDGDIYPGTVGKNVTVNAEDNITAGGTGYVFSHWAKAANGAVLSTNASYDVYLASDAPVTIYAVYKPGAGNPTPVPVVAMADIYRLTAEDGTNKLVFTTTMSVPDGYTVTESGILYSIDTALEGKNTDELNEAIILNGTGVKKSVLNGAKTNLLSMRITEANEGRKIYVRGYMICTNPDGESVVYYSDSAYSSYAAASPLATAQAAN